MRAAIISVTEKGAVLGEKIAERLFPEIPAKRFCFRKNSVGIPHNGAEFYDDLSKLTEDVFGKFDGIVFVCACGIAVREIAPFVRSKATDPAVTVVDDCGKFVVPILSGHLGGANILAEIIAEKIGAIPVITTATDISGKFSPDSFAAANRLIVTDLAAAKAVASAVLRGEKIGLKSEFPFLNLPVELSLNEKTKIGIQIAEKRLTEPFETTLTLIPKNIIAGVGCRKNTELAEIENAVFSRLRELGIDEKRLCALASADIKRGEKGLLEFAEKYKLTLKFFSAEELMSAKGEFNSSAFVEKITGADNVCERAAVCFGGRVIAPKAVSGRVTTAIAQLPVRLDFERRTL